MLKLGEVRPRGVFQNYDRLRSGKVTAGVFTRVIDSLKLKMNSKELDALIARYQDSDSQLVSYDSFCSDIETGTYPSPSPISCS